MDSHNLGRSDYQGRRIKFSDLGESDLYVDAVYEGGTEGNIRDDPISKLLSCGNQGGFRSRKARIDNPSRKFAFVVLYTDLSDPDWPDEMDPERGRFTYFGDNKKPGHELHATGGNQILREAFDAIHRSPANRNSIPPFFVFEKHGTARDVVFRGLAVPGTADLGSDGDLVAIWRTTNSLRFQNYRAVFTILDTECVSREWINPMARGSTDDEHAPDAWRSWLESGRGRSLIAPRTRGFRTPEEQQPRSEATEERAMIHAIYEHFNNNPTGFEHLAAHLWQMLCADVEIGVTRPTRDGGRDAIGIQRIGPRSDPIRLEFALEAKCWKPGHGVGVKELSRLISRLRFRQYGVLVTTSFVNQQAYSEIRQDQHPVVVLSASDIIDIFRKQGHGSAQAVKMFLDREFPQ
ncbi:MAG TPA: restriction endonuclease [Chloroflexi bacterium]|nr:restriction endonuclease [Chloroflexota bacterium]